MPLSKMPKHVQDFGRFKRTDGEEFVVVGGLWESPPEVEYWLGYYVAEHKTWPPLRVTLIIPKRIAPNIKSALSIAAAGPLDEVKSEISKVTENGRDLTLYPSLDGWSLLG